jgi:hypothetical protein
VLVANPVNLPAATVPNLSLGIAMAYPGDDRAEDHRQEGTVKQRMTVSTLQTYKAHKGWDARVTFALGFGYLLPESGWCRVLALWRFVGVPFFRAFRAP